MPPPVPALALRPATPADTDFQRHLYTLVKTEELGAGPWPPAQRDALFQMQYTAQQRGYQAQYPGFETWLITRDGVPIGRTMLAWQPDRLQLVGISLLPAQQRQGIGAWVLQAHLAEAHRRGLPVYLSVRTDNPARRLYERLGFLQGSANEVYMEMVHPGGTGPGR